MFNTIINLPLKIQNVNMALLDTKENIRPLRYPQAFELYKNLNQNLWNPYEVPMAKDVEDWNNCSKPEKQVMSKVLRGFTIAEGLIADNWSCGIAPRIPVAELQLLFKQFSYQETIHETAYDHLEATLGIDTHEEFKQDKIAQQKLASIFEFSREDNLALNLAVFGAGVEGTSLFASFAILLSFNNINKFQGVGTIISWSAIEEGDCHSRVAIQLYHELINDYPEMKVEDSVLYESIDLIVQNEIAFINHCFGEYDSIPSISKKEALDFILYRANIKLKELGLEPQYDVTIEDVERILTFFNSLIGGSASTDFFAVKTNGTSYTAGYKRDYSLVKKETLDNLLSYA